ncbi:hypothetical protein DVH05_026543 [Phytophthora capsici]|nr:hypothetical protein DVH05_026543 [Phytophthora capsici]
MLRQLPQPPSPPLSLSQDVEATQLSACDSSAVAPIERAKDSQVFRVQLAQDTNIDETAFSQKNTASASSQENTASASYQDRASLVSNQDDVRGNESERTKMNLSTTVMMRTGAPTKVLTTLK